MATLGGLYYPIYFIQLNAIKSGVSEGLAFYTVCISFSFFFALHNLHIVHRPFLDRRAKWSKCSWPSDVEYASLKDWSIQCGRSGRLLGLNSHFLFTGCVPNGRSDDFCRFVWFFLWNM